MLIAVSSFGESLRRVSLTAPAEAILNIPADFAYQVVNFLDTGLNLPDELFLCGVNRAGEGD
jgi:hypothetical protein